MFWILKRVHNLQFNTSVLISRTSVLPATAFCAILSDGFSQIPSDHACICSQDIVEINKYPLLNGPCNIPLGCLFPGADNSAGWLLVTH